MSEPCASTTVLIAALLTLLEFNVVNAQTPGATDPVNLDIGAPTTDSASSGVCKQPGDSTQPLRVTEVGVRGAWSGKIDLPIKPGDLLTAENSSAALHAVRDAIEKRSSAPYFQTLGEFAVTVIDTECDRSGPEQTVRFYLVPHTVSLSIVRVGNNVLPIPRRLPLPFDAVPAPIRVLMPSVGAGYNASQGATWSAAIAPTLYEAEQHKVTASIDATQASHENFYDDRAKLDYQWQPTEHLLRAARFAVGYDRLREPLGDAAHRRDTSQLQLGSTFKLAPNTRLYVDAGFARNREVLESISASQSQQEDEQSGRVLYEFIPARLEGFGRAALWLSNRDDYQQVVARAAYAKELELRPNQSLGLEVTVGAGKIFGQPPDYSRFFGGAATSQFVYDSATSSALESSPRGPLLRSFGENAAQLTPTLGGTRFWHVNIDVAVPIQAWSYPLVPNEVTGIPNADGTDATLKQVLQRQIDVTGKSMLQGTLKAQGLNPAQAEKRATDILGEVQPAAHYVINQANVFAIRPFATVDVAGLSDDAHSETWVAAGVGVQAIILTARLEAGYARTLQGPTFGDRGAIFARLVFQRLF